MQTLWERSVQKTVVSVNCGNSCSAPELDVVSLLFSLILSTIVGQILLTFIQFHLPFFKKAVNQVHHAYPAVIKHGLLENGLLISNFPPIKTSIQFGDFPAM